MLGYTLYPLAGVRKDHPRLCVYARFSGANNARQRPFLSRVKVRVDTTRSVTVWITERDSSHVGKPHPEHLPHEMEIRFLANRPLTALGLA